MMLLSLVWLGLGLLIGLLACVARKSVMTSTQWLFVMGVGAVVALVGGWLGVWLLGRYFSTPMALWLAIVGSVMLSRIPFKAKNRCTSAPMTK